MSTYEEGLANISKLKPCPVKVTIHTGKMLKDLTQVARSNPDKIEPIIVAVLGSEQYVANGDLRVKSFENAGKDSLNAWFVTVKSIADVVKLHLDLNIHGSINPLKMADAVHYLEKHNAASSVDKRYVELAKKTLHPKVRLAWDEFLIEACVRHPNVDLPIHVIEQITEFSTEKEQLDATVVILDSMRNLKSNKFVFPAPPALEVILSSLIQGNKEKDMIIFEPKTGPGEEWGKPDKKEAENLIRGSPYNGLVHCKCGRDMLLDTKTHKVSNVRLDSENDIMKLEDGDGQPLFALPPKYLKFLEPEEGQPLRIVAMDGPKELEKFAKSLKQNTSFKMVIITAK
ncbi:MAG: hypothetical protein KGI05_00355 [Thaumarchaeota archaeon]|nr:hypothetical protein [Nitrososphaerota archaeon]